MVLTFTLVII